MRAAHVSLGSVLAILLMASGLGGCLAILLPPTQVSFATGAASGSFRASDGSMQTTVGAPTLTLRGSLNPLQGFEVLQRRPVDVSFGYAADFARTNASTTRLVHGPYLEVGAFPFGGDVQGGRWRLGFHLSGDLPIVDSSHGRAMGYGATVSSTLELLGFADAHGSGSSGGGGLSAGAGAAHGEGGVGIQAFSSIRAVDGEVYWVLGIGLTVRIPAVAAIGVFIPFPN